MKICNTSVDIKIMSNHAPNLLYPHLQLETESFLKTIKTFYKYAMSYDLLLLLLFLIIIYCNTLSSAECGFFIQKKTYICTFLNQETKNLVSRVYSKPCLWTCYLLSQSDISVQIFSVICIALWFLEKAIELQLKNVGIFATQWTC